MAKSKLPKHGAPIEVETVVSPLVNKNFRARIIFKSSHVDEILIVAESTNALDIIRGDFYRYLDSGQPRFGRYSIQSGDLIVDWRDVSSLRTWVEPK